MCTLVHLLIASRGLMPHVLKRASATSFFLILKHDISLCYSFRAMMKPLAVSAGDMRYALAILTHFSSPSFASLAQIAVQQNRWETSLSRMLKAISLSSI